MAAIIKFGAWFTRFSIQNLRRFPNHSRLLYSLMLSNQYGKRPINTSVFEAIYTMPTQDYQALKLKASHPKLYTQLLSGFVRWMRFICALPKCEWKSSRAQPLQARLYSYLREQCSRTKLICTQQMTTARQNTSAAPKSKARERRKGKKWLTLPWSGRPQWFEVASVTDGVKIKSRDRTQCLHKSQLSMNE